METRHTLVEELKIPGPLGLASKSYHVKFTGIGDAWIGLQNASLVTQDELYLAGDWSYPSKLGSYIAALIIVRNSLGLNISKNTYVPADIDPV